MKWVRDLTGRFPERPHYDPSELDYECEGILSGFLNSKYGTIGFPVSTDDLTVLIERDTSNLDLYADLSAEGDDIEGVTDFYPKKKPVVKITKDLSLETWRENRLRTTLMHEYGHVKFHAFLWDFTRVKLISDSSLRKGPRCKRTTIINASGTDWMEWQAGYISGAFLMPITALKDLVYSSFREWGVYKYLTAGSDHAEELITRVSKTFQVSRDAARVRLSQLNFISKLEQAMPLFD